MAILIKDMEMPETCDECDFHIYHSDGEYICVATPLLYPWNLANYKGGRKDWCPLVEVSDNGKVREIGFAECANALLKMWIDNVVTDGEYNRIASKLHTYWTGMGGHE